MTITENINKWLAEGERGISSEAIVSHLTGINIGSKHCFTNHPSDPDDFRRCVLLIEAAPEIRPELHRMGEVSAVWGNLVAEWDNLTTLMRYDWHKCYDRMNKLGC